MSDALDTELTMPNAKPFDPDVFRDICFVIMPFGKKTVGTGEAAREVDFDHIFETIFEPAINLSRVSGESMCS